MPIQNTNNGTLQAVSDAMLVELKQCFMEAYDDNQDGKIDIREVMNYAYRCNRYFGDLRAYPFPSWSD